MQLGRAREPQSEKSGKAPHWQGSRPGRSGASVLWGERRSRSRTEARNAPRPRGQPRTPAGVVRLPCLGLRPRLWRTGLGGARVAVRTACWAPEAAFFRSLSATRSLPRAAGVPARRGLRAGSGGRGQSSRTECGLTDLTPETLTLQGARPQKQPLKTQEVVFFS